jgi:shikimate dehydrogenase
MVDKKTSFNDMDCFVAKAAPRYGVMGYPLAHSYSPFIHQAFAKQVGISICYEKWVVAPKDFKQALTHFKQQGGRGLNITMPLKELAYSVSTQLSEAAKLAGAVNTLSFVDDTIIGDNTDGIGLVRDLTQNQHLSLAGKNILIIGAGGAARGAISALIQENPALIVVCNRNRDRAQTLANAFKDNFSVQIFSFAEVIPESFDLVINATPLSQVNDALQLPSISLLPGATCYDMVYGLKTNAFLQWGKDLGATTLLDGLGMLVEQAAASFQIWHGVYPLTAPVIQSLRNLIDNE